MIMQTKSLSFDNDDDDDDDKGQDRLCLFPLSIQNTSRKDNNKKRQREPLQRPTQQRQPKKFNLFILYVLYFLYDLGIGAITRTL